MLIKEWMATTILTVDANTSVMRATRTMKENNIRRLPVLSHGKLAGIITDRDLKEASPSSQTDMDIHEMYYLLSEMKVKDVMTKNPITLNENDSLEKAALIMLRKTISGILVLDDSKNLVGILSESDVLQGFIHATGIQDGAYQYVMDMSDKSGSVSKLIDIFRDHKARILSILTSFEDSASGAKRVAVRIMLDDDGLKSLTAELASMDDYTMITHGMDDLSDLLSNNFSS